MPEAPESEMIGACVVGDVVLLLLVVRFLLTASAAGEIELNAWIHYPVSIPNELLFAS
jgi:hypothetical protein